jgi:hypothetical protein
MMKKYLFSFTFLFLAFFSVQAQNLALYHNGELLDDTVVITEYNANYGEMTFEANIKNTGTTAANVWAVRETISAVEGTTNYFCWAQNCLPSDVDTSLNFQIIAPGEMSEDGEFSGHYMPMDHAGTTTVKYTFYDPDQKNISVSVVVHFKYGENNNDIEIIYNDEVVDDTVVINEYNEALGEMTFEANVKNNTERDLNLYATRKVISAVENTVNYFCWAGNCLPSDVDTSINFLTIPSGEMSLDGGFSGHYIPSGNQGISIIQYTFYSESKYEGSVIVKYTYNSSGIDDNVYDGVKFSNIYPNPATDMVTIDYSLKNKDKAYIKVVNILGNVVKTIELSSGSSAAKFNVSDLSEGVYFYSIVVDRKVYKTKKLVIR